MLTTAIENKVISIVEDATITNIDSYEVKGIDKVLKDFDQYEQYPRVVVSCEEADSMEEQIATIAPENRDYTVNIMVLSFNSNYDEMILQRDIVTDRIVAALKADKRLGNLADNTTSERVWNSKPRKVKYAKSGIEDSYQGLAWIEFLVQTSEI